MTKTRIFEELTTALGGKEQITEQNFADLLVKNRTKVREILKNDTLQEQKYKNQDSNTSWYLFFADFREYLGIPRFMDLDTFNAFTEVIMVSGESLNYDDFLKIFKKSQTQSKITQENSQYSGPKVDKLIKNQGEYLAQGLVELVANAIDATVPDKSIGRFGEGFYQSLKFLKGGDSRLLVQTKKAGEKAFELSLKEENGMNQIGSVGIEKDEIGTTIQLQKKLTQSEQEELKKFLISRFKTNKKTRIILNGNLINNLEKYIYYNGKGLTQTEMEVFIEVNESGFRVSDTGVGMSARELSEKLLSPNASSKTRLNADSMSYEEISQNSKNETSFFYNHFKSSKQYKENNVKKTKQSFIRLQVGGVLIEEFSSPTSYDIEEFCLEFPSFTWLPESRNKIELTKEVVVSLKIAMEKISSKVSDKKEQLMLLESIAKIIKHLKSRENSSASNDAKYDIGKIAKQTFKSIKQDLEKEGKVVVATISGIQDIIPESENVVFIDEELAKFEISKIPNIQKLANIKNKKRDFYSLEFCEKAHYDYLILPNAILVNAKYIKDQRSLDLINTQVNLNTGYEQGEDKVFYGIIEDDASDEENKKKQTRKEEISKQNETKYSSEEKEIIFAKFEKISDDFEFHTGKYIDELREYFKSMSEAISENRSARIELFLSSSIYKITFFLFNKLNLKQNFNFSDHTYEIFYDFAQKSNQKSFECFLMFFQKIQYLTQAETYLTQIIDLLNDEKNARYILQYLELFETISVNDIQDLFAKFEESETGEQNEVPSTKQMLFNIKKYLKENNYVFESFESVGRTEIFFLIGTECGKKLFFHNDKYVNLFDGEFSDLSDIHTGPTGDLRGIAEIDGKEVLFKDNGNTMIKIGGDVTEYGGLHTGPDGDLRGIAKLDENQVLFKDDGNTIIGTIAGEICKYYAIYTGLDGDLRGYAEVDEKEVLFKDDGNTVIETIGCKKYSELDFIHTGPDGDLRGIAEIDGKELLFKDNGNTVIEKIGGKLCIFYDIHTGPDGDLRGYAKIDGNKVLFKDNGNTVIETICGENPSGLNNIHTGPDGDLRGEVRVNNKWIGFKDDGITVIEKIGGKQFVQVNIHTGPDGDIRGFVDDKYFIGDIIVDDFFENDELGKETTTSKKLENFVEFLCKGGEFLQEQKNQIDFDSHNTIGLTDLIGISRFFSNGIESLKAQEHSYSKIEAQKSFLLLKTFWNKVFGGISNQKKQEIIYQQPFQIGENSLGIIDDLKQKVSQKLVNRIPYQRQITSTIDGQDRASMIWLREVVQNSRDAILKSRKNGNQNENIGNIEVEFYQNNASWISRITDNVGMTSYEVFKYLLTPGISGKTGEDGATGMFGQGFYSLMIGAKELNLKTSTGDGKTTYVQLLPKYNDNKDIIDFEITYDIKQETFTGTVIERYDENEGIGGNIGALIGISNLEKYVGNVDDVNISYNSQKIHSPENVNTLETEKVPGLGILSLKQSKDKQERLTKDNLFLSEIKDEYLNFFPDFMIDYIRKNGYSLDLPANIGLTKTRNAITDFEENLEILKPHIFNLITRHIVKEYLSGKIRLPMMPLDYYGLDLYEMQFKKEIVEFASKVNSGKYLTSAEILQLKDRGLMIQYLINLQVQNNGERTSIRELKKRRDDEAFLKKHTQDTYVINNNAESLNTGMERGQRQSIFFEGEDENKEVKEFMTKLEGNYIPVVEKIFGSSIKFGVYERKDKEESRAVDYGFDENGDIYFYFNVRFLQKFMNFQSYELIELMTHEFTHLVEDYVKGYGIDFEEFLKSGKNLKELSTGKTFVGEVSFGSHQKDLDHSHSFEKIQRDILKMMTREGM